MLRSKAIQEQKSSKVLMGTATPSKKKVAQSQIDGHLALEVPLEYLEN